MASEKIPSSVVEDRWIEVDGLRIHYLAAGAGNPPILLLHGGGLDSAWLSYARSIGAIARGHSVIAPDLPGYGQSDKPDAKYCTEYHTDFLARILDALNIKRVCLVGLSMGGAVALGYALRSPENVDRLILVSSYGLGNAIPARLLMVLLVQVPLLADIVAAGMCRSSEFVKWGLQRLVHDKTTVTEDLVEETRILACNSRAGLAFRAYGRSEITGRGLRTDFSRQLPDVRVPTLLLHCTDDRLVPLRLAERAAERIPNAVLRVIPNCGHWLPLEKPREFAETVLEFAGRER